MEQASWTPKQIVAELNKYIVGQGEAKKSVLLPCATAGAANA